MVVVHVQVSDATAAVARGSHRWSWVVLQEVQALASLNLLAKIANIVHVTLEGL